jgi:ergothioneine biosynthesis protein EgtB
MQEALARRFRALRARSEALAAPLSPEARQVQSLPEASPTRWHLGHTTWFLEALLLAEAGFAPISPGHEAVYNSYYDAFGAPWPRALRGMLLRPDTEEVHAYRTAVDARVCGWLANGPVPAALLPRLELAMAHEAQHQELILTDALHLLAHQPLPCVYRAGLPLTAPRDLAPTRWVELEGGVVRLGATATDGFSFDHEGPAHPALVLPFAIATRPMRVADVLAFVEAGGYDTPSLWRAEGFARARREGWRAPLHATVEDGVYRVHSLRGSDTPHPDTPAAHLSWYEADALARFLGGRLPTEAEWELAARSAPEGATNLGDGPLVPLPSDGDALGQLIGDVWEWTGSAFLPYPGFRPLPGAPGEYNGKFMAQQMVLRGGSCLTTPGFVHAASRNYWAPETRFQMTGARLARDLGRGA